MAGEIIDVGYYSILIDSQFARPVDIFSIHKICMV